MSLYNWVRRCERVKVSINKDKCKKDTNLIIDNEVEQDDSELDYDSDRQNDESESENEEFPTYNESTDGIPPPMAKKNLPENTYPFIYGHPLADSHAIALSTENDKVVPNFIGPGLPRRDKG
ncbi:hypothetical protein K435DRAFT_593481, partial [Dendrothele bispora CBS 962.96]